MNPDSSCAAATKHGIVLSDEQQLCVTEAMTTTSNLLISACAGGAKTTTMCAIARAFGPGRSVVALAFGTDAATSLEQKMPYYVQSSTFHRFCKQALEKFLNVRYLEAKGSRCRDILKMLVPDFKDRRELEDNVLILVSRFKSTTLPSTPASIREVADRFDIDATDRQLGVALRVLAECEAPNPKVIDFDDMLWLAFRWNVPFPRVDVVLLDEAQDTNGVQRALLEKMLRPASAQHESARLIAVGDPHQSIYGFRGADHDAMRALHDDFAIRELSLSVSYRCSQSVVKEAQKYL